MAIESRWVVSGKHNHCPVCGRSKDSDCRTSRDGEAVLCHKPKDYSPDVVVKGLGDSQEWVFKGNTRDGRAGIFTIKKAGKATFGKVLEFRRPVDFVVQPTEPTPPAPLPPEPPTLARLPQPRQPAGSPYIYAEALRINRAHLADGKKAFFCQHRDGERWQPGAGPNPWPVFNEPDAIAAGGWILETEGEKCAELAAAAAFVAISQPGFAHQPLQSRERYARMQGAGVTGVVYLADNDDTGKARAMECAEGAALAGLPFLVVHAAGVWPDIPEGGSLDDAPGTTAEQLEEIQDAALVAYLTQLPAGPAPIEQPEPAEPTPDEQPQPQPIEPPRDEQIQTLLDHLLDLQLDPKDPWAKQQATRAELWNLGVRGDAIDDRIMYALAERWGLPLKIGHEGARRGRSIADPLDSPAEDLLPGFLLWRRDHVLFGAGGSGKTLAAASMGVSIIKGQPFLDQQIAPEPSGRILWIGSDGGEGARAMVAEYLEDLGVADDPDIIDGFTIWTAEGSDKIPAWACSPRGLLELKEELETGGYALVVIDSLKAVLELAGINFGIGPVGTLMRFMQALVGRHCSLLWLHHPAGGKAAGKGLQAAAGSQNINQIPSAVHQLTRVVGDRGPVNEWSVHKLRGSQSREFSYRLSEDGFEVTKGEVTGNAREAIIDSIKTRTESGLPTQTGLIVTELFGTSESTIRNNLTWLRKRGYVRKAGTAWKLTPDGQKAWELISQGVKKPWL